MIRRAGTALLVVALAGAVALSSLGSGDRAERAAAEPLFEVGLAHAGYVPTLDGSKPIFVLVLGDNYRKKIEESHLTDSIHVVGINPAKNQASILGFPRDSWVPIPGRGNAKINEAYDAGGAKLAIQTIEDLTGLTMDYYVVTGFEGFKSIVTEVGGVQVNVPYPIDDKSSKAHFKKGKTDMTGKEALSFVRSRYDVPNGDFSRSENQGLFLTSMLAQMNKIYKRDPSVIFRYLGAGMRNTNTDVPFDQLLKLAFLASQIPAKGVRNVVAPGSIGNAGPVSIVKLSSGAKRFYKDMKADGLIGK